MHQITSDQFKEAVKMDPAWASKLTEPVEITGWCDMSNSKITHLSPLLRFKPNADELKNGGEVAIAFDNCRHLKKIEGTFYDEVSFIDCGAEEIGELEVHAGPDGMTAHFNGCTNLKVARGTFHGGVTFSHTGVEKIDTENLHVTRPDADGVAVKFSYCKKLKVLEGDYPGSVHAFESGIEKIGKLTCQMNKNGITLDLDKCPNLREIPDRLISGALLEESLRTKTEKQIAARPRLKQPTLEL